MIKNLLLLGIPLFFSASNLFAQRIIKGQITDSRDKQPLPGVSVSLKGTTSGTVTNNNGDYNITVNIDNPVLVFKFVGYLTQEKPADRESVINVQLSEDNKQLNEVVVTALGIKREQKSLGYSTQTVKGSDLTITKDQNVIGDLAGKISGAQVTGSSGANLGGTAKIKLRGINSLDGSGSPLMVVDGTPVAQDNFGDDENGVDRGNISQDINPDDIESVSVLKGPAASALYGLRGQYGAILITTKKGIKGAKNVSVSVNSAFSFERIGNFQPLQNIYGVGNNQTFSTLDNGQKYINGNDESWGPKMDGTPVRMFYSFYPEDLQYGQLTPFVPHPDNIKDYYQTGLNINNGVTVTGGSENASYRLSYNNNYIKGTMPNTSLTRNNFGLSTSLNLNAKLTLGANVNYATNSAQRPTQGYQGSFTGAQQWFQRNLDINRLRNYKYSDGTILNWNVNPNSAGVITNNKPSDWDNPFFDAYEVLNNDSRQRVFGDVNLTYQVLPGLKLSGFVRSDFYTQDITNKTAFGGRLDEGYAAGKYQNTENNYEFLGQYDKKWDDFSSNFLLGANLLTQNYSQLYAATVGGLSSPGDYTIGASVSRPISTSYLRKKQVRSAYATGSFGYKDIYFLEASLRNDISSALPANNNSYWYSSVSGSFVFSELLKWEPLSFGKLRAGYAVAGSDLAPYQTQYTYELGTVYPGINPITVPELLNNPNIKPSFANSLELGTDLKFFKNRLGLAFTYYNQQNKNQIINLSVSGASGYDQTVVNAGLIENKGIEVSLTGRPVQSKLFTWDAILNVAHNTSKIKELYPGVNTYQLDVQTYSSVSVYLNATLNKGFGNIVGQGYQRDPATGKILLGTDNMPLYDNNHDFGSVLPKFTGGFQNNFQIWKFNLSAMIDFQDGGKFYSWSQMLSVKSGQSAETAVLNDKGVNVREPIANGGGVKITGISKATGQEVTAYVDARGYYRNVLGTQVTENWIYDASYIKLREVSLGYTFDKGLSRKSPFKAIKIALIARNPWMIWQKAPKGVDPSELSSGSNSISWIEKGELPTVRSYGLNLNLTF
ncbi:SusC/RagA family TonB-linked outer membrane protein [Mucilaginibacter sabulilitoris]|uniref:SusC/RagA family TonB-linked outer membrane protein n=1 Tax=Mucilaginibacter sabulilitoris TaxID=1173583 RepID=A0ABZ0TQW9_9SPHI|nr:SusC/RagA family TonB-linked outer membrane protein [Mucilaginibacter sabulilitoris]WPU95534.1 SusC/RagA family TonB-linked outer membrane protein [Mucilaginibacter sabulilitoris]